MATFKLFYKTSELLDFIKRESLLPYCWSDGSGMYHFYMVDSRRDPFIYVDGLARSSTYLCNHPEIKDVSMHFVTHKSNYYRLVKKIDLLPFGINVTSPKGYHTCKSYELLPYNHLEFNVLQKLRELDSNHSGKLEVRVYVL